MGRIRTTPKKFQLSGFSLLRLFLSFVFLSAAAYRVVFFGEAVSNFSWLGLPFPKTLVVLSIAAEALAGVCLFLNKFVRIALGSLGVMALGAVLVSLKTSLSLSYSELFSLTGTPTNVFLHLTYFVCLIALFLKTQEKE